jgi:ribosome-associated protein
MQENGDTQTRKGFPMPRHFAIRDAHIQLEQLLKATGLAQSGGTAHAAISDGLVSVDSEIETRQRAKLRPGQRLEFAGEVVEWVALAAG